MRTRRISILTLIPVLVGLVWFQGCSDDPEQPTSGTVTALVIDASVGPVAGVNVTLAPANITVKTDKDGRAVFTVPPGDYFVDAQVCCVGPGYIDYHLPVTVRGGRMTEVKMHSCLICV